MRQSAERLVSEDAPTPAQLFSLAAQGIIVAQRHNKLRTRPKGRKMVLPTQITIPLEGANTPERRYEQSWACGVRRAGFRQWSMRLISRYHVIEDGHGIGSEVQEFKFEWDTERATMAAREIRVAPGLEYDLADIIDRFSARDDIAEEWYWREQMELLTKGDVSDLTRELEKQDGGIVFADMRTNRVA